MPMRSKAQNAAMHAAAAGHSTIGIPKAVAQRFVAEAHGQNIKKLPEHRKPRRKPRVFGSLAPSQPSED